MVGSVGCGSMKRDCMWEEKVLEVEVEGWGGRTSVVCRSHLVV